MGVVHIRAVPDTPWADPDHYERVANALAAVGLPTTEPVVQMMAEMVLSHPDAPDCLRRLADVWAVHGRRPHRPPTA